MEDMAVSINGHKRRTNRQGIPERASSRFGGIPVPGFIIVGRPDIDKKLFRRTKGAIRLHLVLDQEGYLPCFALITEGKLSDVKAAYLFEFAPGTIKEGISKEILIGDALQNIGRSCYNTYIFSYQQAGRILYKPSPRKSSKVRRLGLCRISILK